MGGIFETINEALGSLHGPWGYLFCFGLLLLSGLGVPLPEDVTLFAGGLLSHNGQTNVHLMVAICFVGIMLGDSFVFIMGARFGRPLLRLKIFQKLMHEDRFAQVQEKFHRHGAKILFAARFMPGLRTPTFFVAGMMHVKLRTFLLYDGGAALISAPTIVYLVWYFGEWVIQFIKIVEQNIVAALILIALALLVRWLWHRRRRRAAHSTTDRIQP